MDAYTRGSKQNDGKTTSKDRGRGSQRCTPPVPAGCELEKAPCGGAVRKVGEADLLLAIRACCSLLAFILVWGLPAASLSSECLLPVACSMSSSAASVPLHTRVAREYAPTSATVQQMYQPTVDA